MNTPNTVSVSESEMQLIKNIFVINLDHRYDRRNNIQNQFSGLNFNLTRIPATYMPTFGILGCCKSHINALSVAKKHNLPNIMIIEDDFEWTIDKKYVPKIFNYIYHIFQDIEWDVIMLAFNQAQLAKTNHKFIYKIKKYDSKR